METGGLKVGVEAILNGVDLGQRDRLLGGGRRVRETPLQVGGPTSNASKS